MHGAVCLRPAWNGACRYFDRIVSETIAMSYRDRLGQFAWFFRRKYRILFLTAVSYAALC